MPEASSTSLLTIVIPTRQRGHTLGDTLRSCVEQEEPGNYEILVSDNMSDDGTAELVAKFNDPRIRYVRTPSVLSMEGNWEYAFTHVREGYVMYMGADDALVPGAIKTLRKVIAESGALAVRPPLIAYHWDNFPLDDQAQIARGVPVDDDRWWWEDSQAQLKTCAESLLNHQHFFDVLPTVYHGLVHTSVLQEAHRKNGAVFLSKIPDMFTAVLVAAALPRYARTNTPVSLNAMSCSSNSVAVWLGGHEKDKEMRRFWAEVDHPYEPEIVPDSASPDVTFALPVLIADQYMKLEKRGWAVPKIPVRQVFEATLRGARRWRDRGQFEGTVRVGRGMAEMHGWQADADRLLAENPFRGPATDNHRPRTFYSPAKHMYRHLDLRPQATTGGCSAGHAIMALRRLHQQQRTNLKSVSKPVKPAFKHVASWDLATWCLWALIRQESGRLTGNGVVLAQNDYFLLEQLLNPPSQISGFWFGEQPAANDDFVIVPPGKELPKGNLKPGAVILSLHRDAGEQEPPGEGLRLVSQAPLLCTVEENLALSLAAWQEVLPTAGWKRRAVTLLLAPLWRTLWSRFAEESARPPAPTGWTVVRWSPETTALA